MMATAQRYGEFVADLEAEPSGLRKPHMVGIAGRRAQIRQGCLATKRRWILLRWRRGSGKASTLLSIASRAVFAVAGCIASAGWARAPFRLQLPQLPRGC
jgi:hypothetical protein